MRLSTHPLAVILTASRLIPARFDGYTVGPVVLVRPGTSEALLAHELTHVRQFWRTGGLYGLLTWLSPRWRLRFELEAYRAQLAVTGPLPTLHFAAVLASNYDLSITQEEAYRLLTA
ncbi:DUF4157 domain-containing protein [Cupriavidus pinatubonensis]|uniref:DUF4157 domain-containing protein n=1 Tax=Cupriavidus pinatubonensis TaxID=248026 RepID=UPI001C72DB5E|nr:DUF4157 domain-containing protein [Cupriavidus pinatubonensis]QYY30295.1 DUF4157 domain-containing protein [Cupriavidus pinatubonensis]